MKGKKNQLHVNKGHTSTSSEVFLTSVNYFTIDVTFHI